MAHLTAVPAVTPHIERGYYYYYWLGRGAAFIIIWSTGGYMCGRKDVWVAGEIDAAGNTFVHKGI